MTGIDGDRRRLGEFELEEEIGRGGMGIVYRARPILGDRRPVALKVLPALIGGDPASVERFRREALAASRVSHPGIVPVLAIGEVDGVQYFAMELIDGPSLEHLLDAVADREPDRLAQSLVEESGFDQVFPRLAEADRHDESTQRYARSCVRLARAVADALASAHRAGVVHRDIKPSNVLLRATGRPVLVDFGLARDESSLGLTHSGDAVGTPAYMSPEQACGRKDIDGRADVYGLGATLFEMLTLRPPYQGAHPAEIMRRIVDDPVPDVRTRNPRVPADLAWIVECALRKDPARRYASMDALVADLDDFLAGRPVRSAGLHRSLTVSRLVGRHRPRLRGGLAVAAGLAVALAIAGVVTSLDRSAAGRAALVAARDRLADGFRVARAEEAYGRAAVHLDDGNVARARIEHLQEVFDTAYRAGRHEALVEYLESAFPAAERTAPWWIELHGRALGRGTIEAHLPRGTRLELVPVREGSLVDDAAVAFESGLPIPIGTYLARCVADGGVTVVARLDVHRDELTRFAPPEVAGPLPAGVEAAVADDAAVVAIERGELSERRYRELVADVLDRELRDELLAGLAHGADDARVLELPVRGISWRSARTIAVLAGAHLPDRREYELAACAGIPELAFGHDGGFAWDRIVAASPSAARAPRALADSPDVRAPSGARNLVGNVAEWLADDSAADRWAVGGSWLDDDPARLRIDAVRAFGVDETPSDVGLRLAHTLRVADDATAIEAVRGEFSARLDDGAVGAETSFTLTRTGEVDWTFRLRAPNGRGSWSRADFALPGFRVAARAEVDGDAHGDEPQLRDATGLHAPVRVHVEAGVDRPMPAPIRARLRPTGALFAFGAHHELHVPLTAVGGGPGLTTLTLSPGVRVLDCDPAPQARGVVDGAPVLVFVVDAAADRHDAVVKFRTDGALAMPWPAFATGVRAVERVFAEAERAGGTFRLSAVDDVTAVGSTMSVFARIERGNGGSTRSRDWPVRVLFERQDTAWRLLGAWPVPEVDRGVIVAGRYRNERLGVACVAPDGTRLRRSADGPYELQIEFEPTDPVVAGTRVTVVGTRWERSPRVAREAGAADPAEALAWLVGFDPLVPSDAPPKLDRAEPGTLGPASSPSICAILDRGVIALAGGGARCERWFVVVDGRVALLVRCQADGADDIAARVAFEQADRSWFGRVTAALVVGEPAGRPDPGHK